MSIKTSIQALGLRKAYDDIDKAPKVRMPQAVSILEKVVPSGSTMDAPSRASRPCLLTRTPPGTASS